MCEQIHPASDPTGDGSHHKLEQGLHALQVIHYVTTFGRGALQGLRDQGHWHPCIMLVLHARILTAAVKHHAAFLGLVELQS